MDAGVPSPSITRLLCRGCSHSQTDTTSSPQPHRGPLPYLSGCATCSVLQRCRTNCVPTQVEWAQINALVEDARSNITQLDREILQMNRTHPQADLEQKRDDLRHFVDNAQSLAAPFRMLPPEVLNEILALLCISDYSLSITDSGIKAKTLEWSQVCSFWRTTVLSRPALWATLGIDLSKVSNNGTSHLVLHYLQCSQLQPLNLHISMGSNDNENSSHAYDLYDRLLAEFGRWHTLQLEIPTVGTPRSLTTLSSRFLAPGQVKRFPTLTELHWQWELSLGEPGDICVNLLSLADFPKLLVCSVDSIAPAHQHSIRMPDLVELNLTSYSERHPLAALLQSFPNLRKCGIEELIEEELPNFPLADYPPHNHLCHLEVNHFRDRSSLEHSFHSLSLSHLTSFSLSGALDATVPLVRTGLFPVLASSQLGLRDLTLGYFNDQDVIQILERLPSLTRLRLVGNAEGLVPLFERLMLTSHSPNIVPQLKSLDIENRGRSSKPNGAWFLRLEKPTIDALCDMVESRFISSNDSSVGVLEELTLTSYFYNRGSPRALTLLPSNDRLRERLQSLVDAGLSVKLFY